MSTDTLVLASSFEQRMQQLDALSDPAQSQGEPLPWTADDLQRVQQAHETAENRHMEHLQIQLKSSVKNLESLQTFTPREVLLNFFKLISDEEQWAMLQARQERAEEEQASLERKQARLEAEENLWQARLEKLEALLACEA